MPKKSEQQLVAVTIPIYKEQPNHDELTSLNQCIKILSRYPVVFFAPESLNTAFYEHHCTGKITYIIKRFDDRYFNGITGYNQLMLSEDFYYAFINFKYILIYQLDAFVFRDELEIWCNKGYDYIGAPYIFVDLDNYPIKVFTKYRKLLKLLNRAGVLKYTFRHVGNGGLSLRHVKHTIRLLHLLKALVKKWVLNEDSFFTHCGNLLFPFYKLAPEKDALKFSFEEKPDRAYEINNCEIPFGCHAYLRYNDNNFWTSLLNQTD
ncbi:MAG: hypothetical protein JWR67_967 [Mucilaginibacter sp.]|nr:hypothetical protein [Mucilaginibacter sp.]